MSLQALLWALNEAPVEDQGAVLVLIGLADNAGDDGTGAYPSIATLALRARCSTRSVQRHLRVLEASGVIVKGDQALAARHRGDRRPTVYDLDLSVRRGDIVTPRAVNGVTPEAERGDTGGSHGVTPVGLRTVQPPTEVTVQETPPADAGHDAKAREIVQWWWDGLDVKPAGTKAWFACVSAVKACLKAGHSPKAVATALRAAGTPVTIPRLEIELGRFRGTNGVDLRNVNTAHWDAGGEFDNRRSAP